MASLTRATVALALGFALAGSIPGLVAAGEQHIRDNLYGVCAVDARNMWAVGAFGTIFHSADGGATWDAQVSGTTEQLFGVDFFDDKNGWVVGRSGVILRTRDGGQTWTAQASANTNHLFDVEAVSADRAVAVGDWGTILMTADAGATWEARPLDRDIILNAQAWVDADHGWIVGEAGLIVATADGGKTWTDQVSGVEKTLFGVSFADAQRGWAVGLDGLVVHTADGGLQWRVLRGAADLGALDQVGFKDVSENPTLFDVEVVGSAGYAVGDSGSVFVSDDGGLQWRRATLPPAVRLRWIRSVSVAESGRGLIVGANGLTLGVDGTQISQPETEQHASSSSD